MKIELLLSAVNKFYQENISPISPEHKAQRRMVLWWVKGQIKNKKSLIPIAGDEIIDFEEFVEAAKEYMQEKKLIEIPQINLKLNEQDLDKLLAVISQMTKEKTDDTV